jgi:hypothetical protein
VAFKQAQRDHPLIKKVCELHTFNDTRWNSVFDALRDLFTIPAMSDEPERVFSSCGNMVTAQRGNPSDEAIEEAQCIKNWMKNEVITNLGATFEAVVSQPKDATFL